MFSNIYHGNSLQDWLISFAIILGAIILNFLIVLINNKICKKIAARTTRKIDDRILEELESPIKFAIIILAIWLAFHRLNFAEQTVDFVHKAYRLLIVLNSTWFVARLAGVLLENLFIPATKEFRKRKAKYKNTEELSDKETTEKPYFDYRLLPALKRICYTVIWIIGGVMALSNVGVNVGTLLTGLGIGGLAFALASQDTLKNIFGGVTIFTDRIYRIGDRIKVDGFDGVVEDIGLRSTRIRTTEKRLVTIPNYRMADSSIENVSQEPMRRVLTKIGLAYNTTSDKMQQAINILKNMPNSVNNVYKDVDVAFSDYSTLSLNITFVYWITPQGSTVETPSLVNLEILRAFNAAGINFAVPTQLKVEN